MKGYEDNFIVKEMIFCSFMVLWTSVITKRYSTILTSQNASQRFCYLSNSLHSSSLPIGKLQNLYSRRGKLKRTRNVLK